MNKSFLKILMAFGVCVIIHVAGSAQSSQIWKLWYRQPAAEWNEALPVGNGRLGAMVMGGVTEEQIVLNDITLWSGGRQDADSPEAAKYLPEIRRLLLEGKNKEAEDLTIKYFVCLGKGSGRAKGADLPYGSFQVLGTMSMKFDYGAGDMTPRNYRRELDLNNAVSNTVFEINGIRYERRVIASFGDDLIAIELTASRPGALNFTVSLSRPERATVISTNQELQMFGQMNNGTDGNGMRFFSSVRARSTDGSVSYRKNTIEFKGANRVLLIFSAATDFYKHDAYKEYARRLALTASAKSFNQIDRAHRTGYQRFFNRVALELGDVDAEKMPTDERLTEFAKSPTDHYLPALYFHYGRYLLISSSRPGLLPANLQGLWTKDINTPWNGDYHLNINVQMNYWPAEVTQLPEMHLPLIDLVKTLVEPGRKTARTYYNAGGWVAHTITNVWGYTSPGEHPSWGAFMGASGWLCEHLWEHYTYSQDRAYLQTVYPVMKEAAKFYLDVLIKEPKHGWLVTAPSNSPENSFKLPGTKSVAVSMGPTMDNQILRELFTNTIEASRILGIDAGFSQKLEQAKSQLPPHQIGKYGQLMEWLEDYEETDVKHRHVSLLYGLHPSNQITRTKTPELAQAARVTLERRGDESTGWSMGWKINFWARLGDGNHAFKLIHDLLRPIGSKMYGYNYSNGGGTYINLFDTHPPFQIDGNFGGCAAIAEMLLQSHDGFIELLPALPDEWSEGSYAGLMARGGLMVGLTWKDKHVREIRLEAKAPNTFLIQYPDTGPLKMLRRGAWKPVKPENGMIRVKLNKAEKALITTK